MRILARGRSISGEFMHVLTDGGGALVFLLAMVEKYAKLCGQDINPLQHIIDLTTTKESELYEDSYKRYFRRELPRPIKLTKAYHLPLKTPRRPDFTILQAQMDSKTLIKKAKAQGVSLTVYFGAIYLFCLQNIYYRYQKKNGKHRRPILRVEIPINLRSVFPSKTLRNFALFVMPEIDARLGPYTFEQILKIVHHYMQLETEPIQIQRIITRNVASEKNVLVRAIPLILKVIVLKAAFKNAGPNLYSGVLTNMGNIRFTDATADFIQSIRITAPPPDPMLRINSALISYNNNMVLTFGNQSNSKEFEQEFIKFLQNEDIQVSVLK